MIKFNFHFGPRIFFVLGNVTKIVKDIELLDPSLGSRNNVNDYLEFTCT